MTLDEATAVIKNRVGDQAPVAAVILFDFAEDGVILLNGRETPPGVKNERQDADCTIHISLSSFEAMLEGKDNPQMAFMMGRLRVEGDMNVALQLSSILS